LPSAVWFAVGITLAAGYFVSTLAAGDFVNMYRSIRRKVSEDADGHGY
jgi:hypothetical protein